MAACSAGSVNLSSTRISSSASELPGLLGESSWTSQYSSVGNLIKGRRSQSYTLQALDGEKRESNSERISSSHLSVENLTQR